MLRAAARPPVLRRSEGGGGLKSGGRARWKGSKDVSGKKSGRKCSNHLQPIWHRRNGSQRFFSRRNCLENRVITKQRVLQFKENAEEIIFIIKIVFKN
jgi:hypothetical protein